MIINPMIFYLIHICSTLNCLCFIGLAFAIVAALMRFMIAYYDEEEVAIKAFKKIGIFGLVCLLGVMIIPPKDTCVEMLIASQVNEENISRAKDVIDYIIDKVQEGDNK